MARPSERHWQTRESREGSRAIHSGLRNETEEVKSLIHDTIGDGTVMAIRVTAKELRVFSTRRPMGPIFV